MPELAFVIRQDVFRILGGLKKGPMEVWWLLVKLLEVGPDYVHIPSKLSADARVLVEVGIVQENESGQFRVSPDVAYVSNEPTVGEVLHETA